MNALRPCPRHTTRVWLASCPECTAWFSAQLRPAVRRPAPRVAAAA